jgi:hypothetical protein
LLHQTFRKPSTFFSASIDGRAVLPLELGPEYQNIVVIVQSVYRYKPSAAGDDGAAGDLLEDEADGGSVLPLLSHFPQSPTSSLPPLPPSPLPPFFPVPLRPCPVAPHRPLANLLHRSCWDARWGILEGKRVEASRGFATASSRAGAKTWRSLHEIEFDRTTVLTVAIWPGSMSSCRPFAKGRRVAVAGWQGVFLQKLRLADGLSARVVRALSTLHRLLQTYFMF